MKRTSFLVPVQTPPQSLCVTMKIRFPARSLPLSAQAVLCQSPLGLEVPAQLTAQLQQLEAWCRTWGRLWQRHGGAGLRAARHLCGRVAGKCGCGRRNIAGGRRRLLEVQDNRTGEDKAAGQGPGLRERGKKRQLRLVKKKQGTPTSGWRQHMQGNIAQEKL